MPSFSQSIVGLRIAFLALCFGIVSAPLWTGGAGVDKGQFGSGSRNPHLFPKIGFQDGSWKTFPAAFDAYFGDHFSLRTAYMKLYAFTLWHLFHVSSSSEVLVGRAGWLYYNDVEDNDPIATYRGTNLLVDARWQAARSALVAWRDWLQARGIGFVVCIAPEKTSIYPEYLPPGFATRNHRTRVDQFMEACAGPGDIEVVDLRGPVLQAKQDGKLPLYFRTDTHWNPAGAHVGASVLLKALSSRLPAIEPLDDSDFAPQVEAAPGGDLAKILGIETGLKDWTVAYRPRLPLEEAPLDPDQGVVVTGESRSTLPRALFFRDSFANGMIPFLSPDFSRAVYIWDHQLDPRLIEKEKPDIVVLEMVERYVSHTVDLLPPEEMLRQYPKSFYLP